MRLDAAGLAQHLTTLNLLLFDTAKKATDVVAGLSLIERLLEHLDASDGRLQCLGGETDDFGFVSNLDDTTLDTAGRNSTAALDREHVFNGHQEGLVGFPHGLFDVSIEGFEKLSDTGVLLGIFGVLEGGERRTTNDRTVVAGEVVLGHELTNFELDEIKKFLIVDQVALVEEYDHSRDTNLTSEQDVLASLRHRAVGS